MRRIAVSLVAAALVLSACSDDSPIIDEVVDGASAATAEEADESTTSAAPTTADATTTTAEPTTTTEAPATTAAPPPEASSEYETTDLGDGWIEVGHIAAEGEEPCQCSDGSEYNFYAREGAAGSSRVMVMFEGGGACWNQLTCTPSTGVYKRQVAEDRDGYVATDLTQIGGVFDEENPANPLADYTVVFVPYCTGDTHLGNAEVTYGDGLTIQHRGAVNSQAAMDWVVAEYPDVQDLFVTGMSAGSVPTPLFAGMLADDLPDARVVALADASGAYPTAPEISAVIDANGSMDILPEWDVYAGATADDVGIPALMWGTAIHNPDIVLARYDNAYDGVQSTFRAFLGIGADDLAEEIIRIDSEIEANSRPVSSFVAPGDDHTILTSDRLYTETVEGVAFIDWLSDLVAGEPVPDVVCTDCEG